jgi:O-methyltransferase
MNLFPVVRYFDNKKVDVGMINGPQIDYLTTYLLDAINNNIEGDVVEFGCYVGESSKYLRKTLDVTKSYNKTLHVYDSFEGLPPLSQWEENTNWIPGTLNTTEEVLIENFKANNLKPPIITKGWFKDIPHYKIPDKICFAFLDGDFYDSIYDSLKKIYDKVTDGGYILFHDYERPDLPGVKKAIEDFFTTRGEKYYIEKVCDQLAVIKKNQIVEKLEIKNDDLTIVTGLWDIGRPGRSFDHYLECFDKLLKVNQNMFIFVPKELESFVWERRQKHNTHVRVFELSDIKDMYSPFWDNTQNIRKQQEWLDRASWLPTSPQAALEWYNPIVMSKFSMLHDAAIFNPFNSKKMVWIDGGITNTINYSLLIDQPFFDKLPQYIQPFLFISYHYPYQDEGVQEIHGFEWDKLNEFAGEKVEWVCRGGLFGGTIDSIREINGHYWHLMKNTLDQGLMGTEESLFSILACTQPHICRQSRIEAHGFIQEFVDKVLEDRAELVEVSPQTLEILKPTYFDLSKFKTSIYMLTFNFPHQVEHTIQKWLKHDKFLTSTRNILIDNSTNDEARKANAQICQKYNFEHLITNDNKGICGGRQLAAEHFDQSDSDYYIFLEDDMGIFDPKDNNLCRNGFRKYVPNLYDLIHKVMIRENFDFLKLSYTEVYMDNNIQVSWYNVPQDVRSRVWPNYSKLPVTGLDPNCPRTRFKNIEVLDEVSYASGEIYYANWPMIMNKEGNRKVFLDIKWEHPFEQTWMSYVFQETLKDNIKPGVLLASPIDHERIAHYTPQERREN